MTNARIIEGSFVKFQYRQHHLLGGKQISGQGTVIGKTIVGSDDAWIIKPTNGDVVHVRCAGVSL